MIPTAFSGSVDLTVDNAIQMPVYTKGISSTSEEFQAALDEFRKQSSKKKVVYVWWLPVMPLLK